MIEVEVADGDGDSIRFKQTSNAEYRSPVKWGINENNQIKRDKVQSISAKQKNKNKNFFWTTISLLFWKLL